MNEDLQGSKAQENKIIHELLFLKILTKTGQEINNSEGYIIAKSISSCKFQM